MDEHVTATSSGNARPESRCAKNATEIWCTLTADICTEKATNMPCQSFTEPEMPQKSGEADYVDPIILFEIFSCASTDTLKKGLGGILRIRLPTSTDAVVLGAFYVFLSHMGFGLYVQQRFDLDCDWHMRISGLGAPFRRARQISSFSNKLVLKEQHFELDWQGVRPRF